MASVFGLRLAPTYLQEVRLTGLFVGAGAAMSTYWFAREELWNSTKSLSAVLPGDSPKQLREDVTQGEGQSASLSRSLITKEDKNKVINNWNKAVDFACGKLINTLSEKGW